MRIIATERRAARHVDDGAAALDSKTVDRRATQIGSRAHVDRERLLPDPVPGFEVVLDGQRCDDCRIVDNDIDAPRPCAGVLPEAKPGAWRGKVHAEWLAFRPKLRGDRLGF